MQKKYSMLSHTSEMGDNVLKARPSIQWPLRPPIGILMELHGILVTSDKCTVV